MLGGKSFLLFFLLLFAVPLQAKDPWDADKVTEFGLCQNADLKSEKVLKHLGGLSIQAINEVLQDSLEEAGFGIADYSPIIQDRTRLNQNLVELIGYFVLKHKLKIYDELKDDASLYGRTRRIMPILDLGLKQYNESLAPGLQAMPESIKYLAIAESYLNPQARSEDGAKGIWQLKESTRRDNVPEIFSNLRNESLAQGIYVDTRAAVKYLNKLWDLHGNLSFAIFSYNVGSSQFREAFGDVKGQDFSEFFLSSRLKGYSWRQPKCLFYKFLAMVFIFSYEWPREAVDYIGLDFGTSKETSRGLAFP